jgi:hypothetical protein
MRYAIETAPKDKKFVILEDDALGSFDIARWSSEANEWIGKDGVPSKIMPTHWHPMPRDKYLLQENELSGPPAQPARRRYHLLIDMVAAASVIGLLFFVAHTTELSSQNSKAALSAPQHVDQADAPRTARQAQSLGVAAVPEVPQAFKEERAQALTQELAEARSAIERLETQLQTATDNLTQSLKEEREKSAALTLEVAARQQELTTSAAQHGLGLDEERARGTMLARELAVAQREIERQVAQLRKASEDATKPKQAEGATRAQSLEEERRKTATLAQEAAAARQELTASNIRHRQELDEERARGATMAHELAVAQREIERQAVQLRKAGEDATQLKQAEGATRAQSLEEERQKTATLAQEAAAARQELTASEIRHRQELDEERARGTTLTNELTAARRKIEAQAEQLGQANTQAAQFRQAAENGTAELRQSLQLERKRTAIMEQDLESARRMVDVRVMEPAPTGSVSNALQAAEAVAMTSPAVAEVLGGPEATRLIARASALLGQGDIGAARTVLERAAEAGSAQASFMLAETYDPNILSTWGTYGTRGEVTKARELYAKANAGGIPEAKDRFNALRH